MAANVSFLPCMAISIQAWNLIRVVTYGSVKCEKVL